MGAIDGRGQMTFDRKVRDRVAYHQPVANRSRRVQTDNGRRRQRMLRWIRMTRRRAKARRGSSAESAPMCASSTTARRQIRFALRRVQQRKRQPVEEQRDQQQRVQSARDAPKAANSSNWR